MAGTLLRFALVFAIAAGLGCKGCDALDPLNYIDVKEFYPDLPEYEPDVAEPDMNPDEEPDTGRRPKDVDFVFDFGPAPDVGEQAFTISAVVPDFGPVEGGNRVRIQGTGLQQGSTVFVGVHEMVVDLSGGTLVGNIPPGQGPGPSTVKVISPDGEVRALVDGYTYVETLRVDSIVPGRVPTTGGVEVTITGAGFDDGMGVSFSGDPALRVSVLDDHLARVLVPPRPKGFADLRVTTPTDSVELDDAVEYYEPLRLDAVEPASGSIAGGEMVVLRGAGFTSTTTVRFDTAAAAISSIDTQTQTIEVVTPPHAAGVADVFVQNAVDSAALEDGFYYRADDSPALAAVNPRAGPASGGNVARVVGYGFDAPTIQIRFGGVAAPIAQASPSWADVTVPPGTEGAVDVSMHVDGTEVGRLVAAYTYVRDLTVTGAAPATGPDTGGTMVTVTGSGFSGTETVLVGGVPADFTVTSDGEIVVTTPAHTGGAVDIVVIRDGVEATLEDAFTYTSTLEVWGFSPVRGAIAGGTYVEVRGRGFVGEVAAFLDGTPGTGIRRVDQNNLLFFTPPHPEGEAPLVVAANATMAEAPYTYLYFDPASRFGGVSGGPVEGAVNVTVFALGGGPIENAFVMLSTRADTPYQGWTNALGQVTLSGPDVLGAQTTTATAAGFSSATIETVDAENVTLFLNQLDPSSGSGTIEPPPFGIITGNIKATGKLSNPDDSHTYDMAVVSTTSPNYYGGNPPSGPDAIVIGDGRYRIVTRIGDMAVVGLCGTYHEPTDTFTPLFMAVERFVFVANGDELEIDLLCDIPLDQTHTYKLVNAPYAPDGPNNNLVDVFWDFGFEGFFASPTYGQGFSNLISVPRQPKLEGDIADISFTVIGGAYTGFGAPLSETSKTKIVDVSQPVELPPLLDVPEPVEPLPGGTVQNGMIRFQASGPYYPDFQFLVLRNDMGIPVWQFILPGDVTDVKLPEFPDFSSLPPAERPSPVPGGPLYLTILGARLDGDHVYERFSYRDIDQDVWEARSMSSWLIRLK